MKKTNETRSQRLETINLIVEKIATTGRKIFSYNGVSDKFIIINNKVNITDAYSGNTFCVETKNGYPPNGFHMGGTLWGLTKDFIQFINEGGDTNHNHGYGGLYSPHWGYADSQMIEIQQLAKKLGYLSE